MPEAPKIRHPRQEVALAYALCAERLVAGDPNILNTQLGTVPVLVHLLYQSLEISLKRIGSRFQLLGGKDPDGLNLENSSHDVMALARAIQAGFPEYDVLSLLTATVSDDSLGANYVARMIMSAEFEETRVAYKNRDLGYADYKSFAVFSSHIQEWIKAVKDTAQNLEKFIDVLAYVRTKPADSTKATPG